MSLEWILLLVFTFVLGAGACGLIAGGYEWGRFAALQALRSGSAKWRAYLLALIPSLVLAFTFGFVNHLVSPSMIFLLVAVPAAIGTRIRYHAGQD